MKKEQRWIYICEFCGKKGLSASHMAKHERSCTLNPNRVCGMCREADLPQSTMDDLMAAAMIPHFGDQTPTFSELREAANGCPACMLAGIRQAVALMIPGLTPRDQAYHDKLKALGMAHLSAWEYKQEKETFWNNLNSERVERDRREDMNPY